MISKKFTFLFIAIVILDLIILSISEADEFRVISKPLIIGSIIIYFLRNHYRKTRLHYFLLSALTLSWIGDVSLIFESENSIFFIIGLGSFLLAHLCYVMIFKTQGAVNKSKGAYLFPVLMYGVAMAALLHNHLGEMKIAVYIYMIVILVMLILAIYRKNIADSYILVLCGAILFALSDSILALNKFRTEIVLAPQMIMATYAAAQYLIFWGLLRSFKSEE